jgi:Methyltransferase FkbM domain
MGACVRSTQSACTACDAYALTWLSQWRRAVQDRARSQRLDFIKMDIEGVELSVLQDAASRDVLCNATCIMMELHERKAPGCEGAFRTLLEDGCPGPARLQEVHSPPGLPSMHCLALHDRLCTTSCIRFVPCHIACFAPQVATVGEYVVACQQSAVHLLHASG